MRLRAFVVAAVVLGLLAAPGCGGDRRSEGGYRLEIEGRARIVAVDGDSRTVEDGTHTVAAGDTVRMVEGEAVLSLPGDRSMWLRAAGPNDSSVVTIGAKPDVVEGDAVLLAGREGARFTAGVVDVELGEGAARVQRGLGVTVAVYRGSAEIQSAGLSLGGGLPALRQVSVAASGLFPRRPVPLLYDAAEPDPWDERFLGDAIDLGADLDGLSKGFTNQLGPSIDVSASLLRRVLPVLEEQPTIDDKLADSPRSPGEALVGAAIVVESDRGTFDKRWGEVFSFRSDGARWGLVALDQKVKRDALTTRLRDAFDRSPLLFAVPSRRPRAGGVGPGAPPTTAQPPGGQPPATTSTSTTTTTTTTTTLLPLPLPLDLPPPLGPPSDPEVSDPGTEPPWDPLEVVTDILESLISL